MLTDQDLRELLDFQASSPVVSLYLNTDPSEGNKETHRRHLRALLRQVESAADEEVIERYFEHEFDWSGRSVAVFSCAGQAWFRSFPLAIPLRSRVRVSDRPHVKPLADLLDSYGGYGVALVDKQGARFFYFHLGELIEQEGVMGEAVRHTKRGGGSQAAGRRGGIAGQTNYTEEVAERNLREAAEAAARFFSDKNVRRVLIGGTEENVTLFRNLLPKAWQSLVVGTFPMSMTASHTEVLERTMQIGEEAERRQEAKWVEALITAAAKGKNAVLGLEDTLKALNNGRIQTLFILEGDRQPGYQCSQCSHLTSVEVSSCPYCGGQVKSIPDAVELAVRQVMQSGGEVEVLRQNETLAAKGRIGAMLRY
jgi:peptide subunit release factor 1 (eRF1)